MSGKYVRREMSDELYSFSAAILLPLFYFLRLYHACLLSTLSGLRRMEVILMVYIQQGHWCS